MGNLAFGTQGTGSADQTQSASQELGIPVPGTAGDQETTKKRRHPEKAHTPDVDAQVTLGGAQYFVEGTVAKIDGDYYFVNKDETGEVIRLLVNRDTNLDCATMPASRGNAMTKSEREPATMTPERLSPKEEAPQASEQQLQQGQRKDETARGSGFRIGQCDFQKGDHVKAEVDDNGKVTTLKFLAFTPSVASRSTGPSAGTGQLAMPGQQEKPAQLDMTGGQGYPPKEYAVVPLRLGHLQSASDSPFKSNPVVNLQGDHVGTIQDLLVDTATGRIEYAVVLVDHPDSHLHPLPWSAIKLRNDGGQFKAVVDTNKYKVHPDVTMAEVVDLSPSVQQIVSEMEILRKHEQKKAKERSIDKGIVGPMGESRTGGAGPSGPAGPPRGPAPGFEDEKNKP